MRIFVDADGCPVVEETVRLARRYRVDCVLLCDTAHQLERAGAETVTVSQGADSVDFALVNRVTAGDLVVTQDYGLAAMCLARGARVLHQDGLEYTDENIGGLLAARQQAGRLRRGRFRIRGPKRRKPAQDAAFVAALEAILKETRSGKEKR